MLKNRGLEYSDEDFAKVNPDLRKSLKGLIARFAYGYADQYYFVESSDMGVNKAIEIIDTDYLSEIGLK